MEASLSSLKEKTILITGVAGFIGSHVARQLLECGLHVVGIDNLNDYYDVRLKESRLERLRHFQGFTFVRGDIANKDLVCRLFHDHMPSIVVNLAAQAGVRYSIENPQAYIDSNITGFFNILEACRHSYDRGCTGVEHLVYASSSSVYGMNSRVPYSTDDPVDHPVSLYAATKKSNELMAHAYARLYDIPCTGLRFFTVYGPAGRPDMAYFSFTEKLLQDGRIKLFNHGHCRRDFTYIDDIVTGVCRVMCAAPERQKGEDGLPVPPYRLYNIGNGHPEDLGTFVQTLCDELIGAGILPADFNLEKHCEKVPMQPGDVAETYADTWPLERDFGYRPSTSLKEGLHRFAQWYAQYHKNQEK